MYEVLENGTVHTYTACAPAPTPHTTLTGEGSHVTHSIIRGLTVLARLTRLAGLAEIHTPRGTEVRARATMMEEWVV